MDFFDSATSLDDLIHECREYLQLCVRPIGNNGSTAYVNRCLFCGDQVGQSLPKSSMEQPKYHFDLELIKRYESKRKQLLEAIPKTNIAQPFHPLSYEVFSEKFRSFIDELESINGVNDSILINHFNRFFNNQREKDRELFKTPFSSERDLHQWLQKALSRWFHIYPEVNGTGYLDRKPHGVRLDFILKAKPALLAQGFTEKGIGIEVKYINPSVRDGFHKKAARGIFQALSYWYSGARWTIEEDPNVEVAAVLIFSNLSFTSERESLFEAIGEHYRKYWNAYLGVANHGNVGELIFDGSRNSFYKWRICFAHASYFTGYSNGDLVMGNNYLINKIRIGSRNQ